MADAMRHLGVEVIWYEEHGEIADHFANAIAFFENRLTGIAAVAQQRPASPRSASYKQPASICGWTLGCLP